MRRLYFLLPEVESAKKIVDELLLARIEERHIHIAARDHHALSEAHLPEANLLQESDFVPAVERGLAIGGATGVVADHARRRGPRGWRDPGHRTRRCGRRGLDFRHDRCVGPEFTAQGIRVGDRTGSTDDDAGCAEAPGAGDHGSGQVASSGGRGRGHRAGDSGVPVDPRRFRHGRQQQAGIQPGGGFVIPAKTGIQRLLLRRSVWIPAFAGMTTEPIRARDTGAGLPRPVRCVPILP